MSLNLISRSIFYKLCYSGQLHHYLLKKIQQNHYITILSLHRISPEKNPFWQPLHPKIFESLLIFLKKNFHIVSLDELKEENNKKPKLVLSFDDGYYDFISYAMPILKRYHIRVNQNIIPSQVLGEPALWNIALYDFLNAAPLSLIKQIDFPGFNGKKIRNRNFNKVKFSLNLSRTLKKLSFKERENIWQPIQVLFKKLEPYPKVRMINLSELNQVTAEHDLGVHSYSHNSMGNETFNYFKEDFIKCRNFFLKYNLPPLSIYAFPNGSYRDEQIIYLKQNNINHILLVGDQYACNRSPYPRFNIGAFNHYEAIFQSLGIKARRKTNE